MQALPPHLSSEIFANLFDAYSLFCCQVDHNGRLLQMWGDNGFYGLQAWVPGEELAQQDFLLGMPFNEAWVMRDVNVSEGNHADIYFTPSTQEKLYLIFVSTQGSIARRREIQQRGNELTLLHEQNKKLIEQLEHTQLELRQENLSKSHFIAGMSHEFRTPLTSILGYTQLIGDQARLSHETQEYLGAVERASQHLLSLVENLLDQAQFETQEFKLQRINTSLEDLITEVAAIVAPLASVKGLAFSADITPRCTRFAYLDNLRVRQILINLLGNAVKFTADGQVSLLVDEDQDNLIFEVTDTGPGIPKAQQAHVFKAFGRINEHSGSPGVGLGLSITKRLLKRMRGHIELHSEEGKGCTFRVTMPYHAAGEDYIFLQTQPIKSISPEEVQRTKTILLAEDNPDISNLLKILLKRANYEVTIAENGQLALAYARARDFDMIISDIQMPILSGLDLVKHLRAEHFNKPVIALTASHKASEQQEMLDAGFSAFLTKPIEISKLLETLERLSMESSSLNRYP